MTLEFWGEDGSIREITCDAEVDDRGVELKRRALAAAYGPNFGGVDARAPEVTLWLGEGEIEDEHTLAEHSVAEGAILRLRFHTDSITEALA